jgi:phosphopantothenoylcysteine decarboxylase/phosphopantothenate--cysteine ligase
MSRNLLLVVTGSIAAFKAASLASKLTQDGFDVRVILSGGAKEFIGTPTFEGLTRNRVYENTFAPGDAMAHIDLARWADLTVVYPASGNTLTKLSHGRADDLVGTLFLAHDFKRPYWIVPAMNPWMLSHPAVAEAITKLKNWGVRVLDSDDGRMACGEVGTGRLVEPEAMLLEIQTHFSSIGTASTSTGRKILVTAGGTSEAIDPVRVLTNTSTGETGVRVANALADQGNSVTLLLAVSSPFVGTVAKNVRMLSYRTFQDLDGAMHSELEKGNFDTLIHAAAVSDYHVDRMETATGKPLSGTVKIHSKEGLTLHLEPNPKILDQVRKYAKNPKLRVISFKLATPSSKGPADLSGYDSDLIVYNAVSGIERGSDRHAGEIYAKTSKGYEIRSTFETKTDLTQTLSRMVNS